jgi:hypothetical protein
VKVNAEAQRLLDDADLPDSDSLAGAAAEYLRRTRRARRYGLIGGLVIGFGPLAGDDDVRLLLPRLLAGYLVGLLVTEWLTPRRDRSARRAADLRVRRVSNLLPRWVRVTIWVVFVPVLAAPLLAMTHPVPGLTHVTVLAYTCATVVTRMPGLAVLVPAAAIGAAGLAAAELALARLAGRSRPADDLDAARLDDILRGISARAVAGGAIALALVLLSGIGFAVDAAAGSTFCPARPGPLVDAYPWAVPLQPWLEWASLGTLAAALVVLAVSRRRDAPLVLPGPAR